MQDKEQLQRPHSTTRSDSVDRCSMAPDWFSRAAPPAPLEHINQAVAREEIAETPHESIADAVWEKQQEHRFWKNEREPYEQFRREEREPDGASFNKDGWYIPPRPAGPPKRLAARVPSSGGPTWAVSAPDIEQAIYTLLCKLKRSPTDDEVAEQLHLTTNHYHQALLLLSDLENEIGLGTMRSRDAATNSIAFIANSRSDAVFCCVRHEMMKLFKTAIETLPERELLVIQLQYAEGFTGVEIRLTLNIDESTLTRLSASAHLHLQARLFGSREADHWVGGDDVQPAHYKGWRKDLKGPKAQIYMAASQSGWLPTGYTWETLGSAAVFNRFIQAYFAINDSGELEQVEHSERSELRVDRYRGRASV